MTLNAYRCPNGHVTYPGHELCPECAEEQTETIDLSDEIGEVVTWTTNTATPPGVRQPNSLAIVEFSVKGTSVRAIGQLAEDAEVEIGDEVRPVYAEELRNPDAGIREKESQEWDGYQFEAV